MSAPFIDINLHGMTKGEAIFRIEEVLSAIDSGTYQLRLIHGFNRGTSLKNMIQEEFRYHPLVKRIEPGDNQGITLLIIRDL